MYLQWSEEESAARIKYKKNTISFIFYSVSYTSLITTITAAFCRQKTSYFSLSLKQQLLLSATSQQLIHPADTPAFSPCRHYNSCFTPCYHNNSCFFLLPQQPLLFPAATITAEIYG